MACSDLLRECYAPNCPSKEALLEIMLLNPCHTLFNHQRKNSRTCRWQNVLDEHEDGLLWADLYPLADDVHELPNRQIRRDQVPATAVTLLAFQPGATHAVKQGLQQQHGRQATNVTGRTSSCRCQEYHSSQPSPRSPAAQKISQSEQRRCSDDPGLKPTVHQWGLTGILSGYLSLIRAASACRFSASPPRTKLPPGGTATGFLAHMVQTCARTLHFPSATGKQVVGQTKTSSAYQARAPP
jgi:hypothetical protein